MNTKKLLFLLSCLLAYHANPLAVTAQTLTERLAGQWQFEAANNGTEVAPGVYSAGTDIIPFTATPSADGTYLACHADALYSRTGTDYPADWRILVEEDDAGRYRLGWVLDASQPVSDKEFLEPAKNFLENGFFYWGDGTETHRYIYLLAENVDASAIIGMTFWSTWSTEGTTEYALSNEEHNAQKMYAVVAQSIPYADSVGWIEIWASPKVRQLSTETGIARQLQPTANSQHPAYDLQGRPLDPHACKGLYIKDGKKFLAR